MKVFYIGVVLPKSGSEGVELASSSDLSSFSFFQRSQVAQFMKFFALTVCNRTPPGQRQSVEEGSDYVGHAYTRQEGLSAIIVSDREYPVRVAFSLLNKVLDEYLSKYPKNQWISATTDNHSGLEFPQLDEYVRKYQDPQQADTIMKVQQELDETKIVLHKTIESVLARGEKLDSLVDKSEALSASSRTFYKSAKKTNSCCVIA